MPKMHIVATTIATPVFLDSYRENLQHYGHSQDVRIWVVGDRKSAPESGEYAAGQRSQGLDVEYLDAPSQEQWLARFPDLEAIIPWNSDNRRNVGFLRALEEGGEVLVAIDDDNYCIPESDFYEGHCHTGSTVEREVVSSDNGWFDICGELLLEPAVAVVARGYPYRKRNPTLIPQGRQSVPIVANAGLWLGDPDVDAATRLACPVVATATSGRRVALAPGIWSPINTQNTSIARRAMPAYYYVRMLEDLPGAKLDRYGDIWSGYFLTRCAEHLNEYIGVGYPTVSHRRNVHDLLSDLRAEIWGMVITPHLIEILRSGRLQGTDYSSSARSLAKLLQSNARELEERTALAGVCDYVYRIGRYLAIWVDVCNELGVS
jgi:Reversibly glycosylated polypeptide